MVDWRTGSVHPGNTAALAGIFPIGSKPPTPALISNPRIILGFICNLQITSMMKETRMREAKKLFLASTHLASLLSIQSGDEANMNLQ
jgi:hypothetical protein